VDRGAAGVKPKKKPRRVVLGVGYPWFSVDRAGRIAYDSVKLTTKPVCNSILFRGKVETVGFKFRDVGNWNKVRLVLEILK
jgi:hypothetical protein